MEDADHSIKKLLQSAMELIELQNDEIALLRETLSAITKLNESQLVEIEEAQGKTRELEKLLHQSDEGLSEALIVLGAMRVNLSRIDNAANSAISKFTDIGFTDMVTEEVKGLSNAVTEANDFELIDAHEKYLKDLRNRINKKGS